MLIFNLGKRFYGSFGFFFDIDGVFLKGKNVIPAAKNAFNLLLDKNGRWKVPCVFVTNAGNKLRKNKAEELSEKFGLYVSPDQVVMSHSPLRMYTQFHRKKVLVCGQGPVKTMAKILGFENVLTIEDVKAQYPHLDVCHHDRPKPAPCAFERYNKPIEAIVLFGEPKNWESCYQVILDMLMTNGQPYKTIVNLNNYSEERVSSSQGLVPYPHIPLLACNMDMLWMADAPLPRIGHGCFMNTLEALYEKLSGRKLYYTALIGKPSELTYHYAEYRLNKFAHDYIGWNENIKRIYCVGDNPQTDIYGANLYNRYLESQHESDLSEDVRKIRQIVSETFFGTNTSLFTTKNIFDNTATMAHQQQHRQVLSGKSTTSANSTLNTDLHFHRLNENANNANRIESEQSPSTPCLAGNGSNVIRAGFAESCQSILVLTGVVRKDSTMDIKSLVELMSQSNVNHNHRDFPDYPELKNPNHVCHSVDDAVLYVYDKERYAQ